MADTFDEQRVKRTLAGERFSSRQSERTEMEANEALAHSLENAELNASLDDSITQEALDRLSTVARSDSVTVALQQGAIFGAHLRKEIATGAFSGFFIALLLAMIKDLADAEQFVLTWVVNFFVTISLLVVIMFQGTYFKRRVFRAVWKRVVVAVFAESIPILNVIPWYTIAILLIKREADKHINEKKEALKKLDADMKRIEAQA